MELWFVLSIMLLDFKVTSMFLLSLVELHFSILTIGSSSTNTDMYLVRRVCSFFVLMLPCCKHAVNCSGISKVFPDLSGTKLFIIDEKSDGFIYNPVCYF